MIKHTERKDLVRSIPILLLFKASSSVSRDVIFDVDLNPPHPSMYDKNGKEFKLGPEKEGHHRFMGHTLTCRGGETNGTEGLPARR